MSHSVFHAVFPVLLLSHGIKAVQKPLVLAGNPILSIELHYLLFINIYL